jgi:hypothetical protein
MNLSAGQVRIITIRTRNLWAGGGEIENREAAYENLAHCFHPNDERRDTADSRAGPGRTGDHGVLPEDERREAEAEIAGVAARRAGLSRGRLQGCMRYSFRARWR